MGGYNFKNKFRGSYALLGWPGKRPFYINWVKQKQRNAGKGPSVLSGTLTLRFPRGCGKDFKVVYIKIKLQKLCLLFFMHTCKTFWILKTTACM